jgi:hypothetical protein
MRTSATILGLLWWFWWSPIETVACRYNVLEVGFMDLDTECYQLLAGVGDETPAEVVFALKETALAVLADSNIRFEIVHLDQQKNQSLSRHFSDHPTGTLPVGVMLSPEGRSFPVELSMPGSFSRSSHQAALRQIVSSPKREELVKKVSQAFGVVLFIEGPQAEENRRAQAVIAEAIEQIKAQMASMPKAISQPPVMMTIEAAEFGRESILLWSLGVETNGVKQAQAAIVYGRARWIGPIIKGEELSVRNLEGILSIIGADCECGLDLSWTQGTRLPVRWDNKQQSEVARRLGFDPESPLVKIEMSRILDRRGGAMASAPDDEATPQETPRMSPAKSLGLAMGGPAARVSRAPWQARPEHRIEGLLRESTWPFLAGLSAIIILTGLGILLRVRAKR